MYLRAKGAAVYGFGGQKTPEPFVNACSRFLYLDKLAVAAAAVDIDTGELTRDEGAGTPLRVPARQAEARRQAGRAAAQRRRGGGGRERLGARRRGRPADRQPGVVRSAQLRLRDAHQAAQGDRAVPARQGGDVRGLGARHPRGPRREGLSAAAKEKAAPKSRFFDRLRRAARFFDPLTASRRPPGFAWPCCSALVLALRSSRVVSVPVLFMALSSFWRRLRQRAFRLPLALSALVGFLALVAGLVRRRWTAAAVGFSPAGATDLAWAPALTSARVGRSRGLRESALREHGDGRGDCAQSEFGLHRVTPDRCIDGKGHFMSRRSGVQGIFERDQS